MVKLHAISFVWQGFEPHLHACDDTPQGFCELDLNILDMEISHHSTCVGTWSEGEYRPCPEKNKVSQGNICQDCANAFLPDLGCNFEPVCDGEICGSKFCHQEHAVYLAFHGEIAKVGMTTSRRVEQRLIEQRADADSIQAKVVGRASARKLECSLSEKLALRQRIREIENMFCLADAPDPERIKNRYEHITGAVECIGLKASPLIFMEGYPLETPLAGMPRLAKVEGRHRGQVIGVKGKFIIYRNGGLKALNLQNVPGRFITC